VTMMYRMLDLDSPGTSLGRYVSRLRQTKSSCRAAEMAGINKDAPTSIDSFTTGPRRRILSDSNRIAITLV
ncbi:MAG: hypothetical protein VX311_17890, partial [Planctomycetota bacterium]|nr:hypothetical protein [Planctomycetota bacterium]